MSIGRIIASRTAMFCCDMQDKFRPSIQHFPAILSNANRLLESAKILDVPLVVTEQYPKGLGSTCEELNIGHCKINCPKTKFSMVLPEVQAFLQSNSSRQTVVLFGIEAHVCIQQTALDLLALGYKVHIVVDATSSRTDVDRFFAFQRMRQAGAHLTTSESMILGLAGASDHPNFRELQKIIKTSAADTNLLQFSCIYAVKRMRGYHVFSCLLVSLLISTTCYYGDKLVAINSQTGNLLVGAVTDNLVHGTIAVVSWILGRYNHHLTKEKSGLRGDLTRGYRSGLATHTLIILESIICGVIACLIDLDHFVAAWSFDIEDALAAPVRGMLHNSAIVILLAVYHYYTPYLSLVILTVAFSTHQLREAVRRGLMFLPIGHTPPISYLLYLTAISLITVIFPRCIPSSQRTVQRDSLLLKEL
eukprot:sb/3465052/